MARSSLHGVAFERHHVVQCRRWHPVRHAAGSFAARRLPSTSNYAAAIDAAELMAHESLPLAGRRVLVTGPRQYASKLCGKLVTAGAQPLWLPTIEIAGLSTDQAQPLLEALSHLASFSHVAFTSRNGITAVLQLLQRARPDDYIEYLRDSGIQLCALGADGDALLAAGLPVHVSPQEASTQGLVRELVATGQAAGARVLCPVPLVTGGLVEPAVVPRFIAALQAAGAEAVRMPAYTTTSLAGRVDCSHELELLLEGRVHAVAFSSTAEAQGLAAMLGGAEVVREMVEQRGVVLAAHGPYTAAGAGEVLGCAVPCVSRSFASFDGLVTALGEALA